MSDRREPSTTKIHLKMLALIERLMTNVEQPLIIVATICTTHGPIDETSEDTVCPRCMAFAYYICRDLKTIVRMLKPLQP